MTSDVLFLCNSSRHELHLFLTFTTGCVCKVRTKDPENFDEEVKSLVTAWRSNVFRIASYNHSSSVSILSSDTSSVSWKVDRVTANNSLSSTASQVTSNIPIPCFLVLGCNRQTQRCLIRLIIS